MIASQYIFLHSTNTIHFSNIFKSLLGVLLNIKDAYSHPLFCRDVDRETGFKTR